MNSLTFCLVLTGFTEPFLKTIPVDAPTMEYQTQLYQPIPCDQSELSHIPIVIDSKDKPSQRCLIAQGTQMIQRNLTLPYHQQTVYGTAQCQSDM